jgi:hypothetical protein
MFNIAARPSALAALVQAKEDADARRAQAEKRLAEAVVLLDDLVRGIGTAPMSTTLSAARLMAGPSGTVHIQAPHLTWRPYQDARAAALRFLGRSI